MNWVILIVLSAIFLSFRTILIKKILIKREILPLLFLISFFSILLTLFFKNQISLSLSPQIYFLLILKSFVISISWYFIYQAYKNLEISTVSPLRNLSPIFLIPLSLIFLNESITTINYLGIFILITSAYLLELKTIKNPLEPLKLIKNKFFIFLILSLIGNSISAILDKTLLKEINYPTLMFVFYVFLTFFYLLTILFKKETKNVKNLFQIKNLIFVVPIVLLAFFSDLTYFAAVAFPSALIILVIPLRRISTLISTILGGEIFKEKHFLYKSLICIIMILGFFLITL